MADGPHLEIQLGHFCTNRCVFCVSAGENRRGLREPVPLQAILDLLGESAARGRRRVTFLGGEPTIQKTFLPALRHAVELGFPEIVIFTNGVRGGDARFLDEVTSLGSFEWRLSIQGADATIHDGVTQRPGSFARALAGLRYLTERGQKITINVCASEPNYRSLPAYPELLEPYAVSQLHVDMLRPSDTGLDDEELAAVMPRLSDLAPVLDEMLTGFEARGGGIDVSIGNFPFCLGVPFAHRIRHDGIETVTVSAVNGQLAIPKDKYRNQRSKAVHPPDCSECTFRPDCRGIAQRYVDRHGSAEFSPVSRQRLAEADRPQRLFVHTCEAYIEALVSSPPPGRSRGMSVLRDGVQRKILVRPALDETPSLEIVLAPREGPTVAAHHAFFSDETLRAGLEGSPADVRAAAASLLPWARARLAAASAGERAWRLRLRARGAPLPGGWTLERETESPSSFTLFYREQAGRIELRIPRRPALPNGVEFVVSADTARGSAERLVAAVGSALRRDPAPSGG